MNVVKEIQRINEYELSRSDYTESASWHAQYKDTAWIFAGNLPFDLTEGDIICIFSQYGEIMNIELIRDKSTGKSKGFAFLQYEDQRSTVLAVDNLGGSKVLDRTLRVDHSWGPKPRRVKKGDEWVEEPYIPTNNAAPKLIEVTSGGSSSRSKRDEKASDNDDLDAEDPMAAYFRDKKRKKKKKEKHHHRDEHKKRRRHRHHDGDY
ncbi:RNA-binding domain-containing protein [Lichtheimia hyalospora FSU 10163]|nr:RNA-binding domain-containing protein [Lichtheimia hyalospora FSU 10163]